MADPPTTSEQSGRRDDLAARVLGGGVRAGQRIAGATGVDHAMDAAVEEAIVGAMESPAVERALIRLAEDGKLQTVLERAIASADIEDAVSRGIDSEAADRIWEEILASDKAQMLVERVAEAPEVRAAIAQQGFGLISDIGRQVSRLTEALDDVVEHVLLRLLGRKEQDAETNQVGLITRIVAAGIDLAMVAGVLSVSSALLSSIGSAVFGSNRGLSDAAIASFSVLGLLIGGSLFVTFWSLVGQTPGMRFLGIRLDADGSAGIGLRRSIRRLFAIPLSLIPFGLGFLAIIPSAERRAWHDRIAGTSVIYDESSAPWSSMPREWARGEGGIGGAPDGGDRRDRASS